MVESALPLVRNGTERFLKLFVPNQNRIYAFILSLVANRSDADDIMQETTVVMWRKFHKFTLGSNFASWGVRIAHYTILDFRKRNRNAPLQFNDRIFEAFKTCAVSMIDDTDDRIEALQHCVNGLGKRDRLLIQMRYKQSYTVRNITERLEMSGRKVYRTLARIHDRLLRCIRRTLIAEGVA